MGLYFIFSQFIDIFLMLFLESYTMKAKCIEQNYDKALYYYEPAVNHNDYDALNGIELIYH